jgi:3-oxoacyl-[acyl-carrier-protein] synthase-3
VIPVRILGTATALPGPPITTAEVVARVSPGKDPARIRAATGIDTRHWAEPGAPVADLATSALRDAIAAAGLAPGDLRRVVLVTSSGGDVIGPATANAVIHALGIDGRCDAFDLNNACMGFLTAFDLAARCVATGLGPVGVVAAEMASRFIRPDDPRPYFVLGDAAAAVVLGAGREGEGILGSFLGNDGAHGSTVYADQPMRTRRIEHARFAVPTREMMRIVGDAMQRSASAVLAACGETLAGVDWVLPHQPNGAMLDLLVDVLGVDRAKIVPVVQEVGSVVSASLPISLDRLLRTRDVRPGARILMIGVGSGLSYGAILHRVGPRDSP